MKRITSLAKTDAPATATVHSSKEKPWHMDKPQMRTFLVTSGSQGHIILKSLSYLKFNS